MFDFPVLLVYTFVKFYSVVSHSLVAEGAVGD